MNTDQLEDELDLRQISAEGRFIAHNLLAIESADLPGVVIKNDWTIILINLPQDNRTSFHKKNYDRRVRQWAKSNGHTVSDRGRISCKIREEYARRGIGQ